MGQKGLIETDRTAAARTRLDQPSAPAPAVLDRLRALQAENEHLQRCWVETRAEVVALAARAEDAHRHLEALLSSRSWLLTAPLRRAITLLRSNSVCEALRRARWALTPVQRRRAEQKNEQAELKRLGELARQLVAAGSFDPDWYLQQNPDVVATKQDPAIHYLLQGSCKVDDPRLGSIPHGIVHAIRTPRRRGLSRLRTIISAAAWSAGTPAPSGPKCFGGGASAP
jgi:hypothetical protein